MSYFEGFSINASRGEFVFLEVNPFQVGDAVEGFGWDATDVVACRSQELQSVHNESRKIVRHSVFKSVSQFGVLFD